MILNILLLIINLGSSDVGTKVFPLLKVAPGPRAAAMGESFVGLADDATACYWNPAGLSQLQNLEIFLSHQEWFYGFRDEYASFGIPLGKGALGLGLVYSRTDGVEFWDENNLPGDTFATQAGYFALGYGHQLKDAFFLGGSIKGLYEDLKVVKGTGVCADLGIFAKPAENLNLGLTFQNIGWGMEYDGENIPLPMNMKLGICFQPGNFNLLSDINVPLDNTPYVNLGAEYNFKNYFAFRAGYRTGPTDFSSLGWLNGVSFGCGIVLSRFTIDYAFVPYGRLGNTHRFSLRARIPLPGSGILKLKVIDARTKLPTSADVIFSGLKSDQGKTNARGEIYLRRLNIGWVKFGVSKDNFLPYGDSVYIVGTGEQSVSVELKKLGYGSIWGMFYDAITRKPIRGTVKYQGVVSGTSMVDSLTGTYTLRNLPVGLYVLELNGPTKNYFAQKCSVYLDYDEVVTKDFYLERKKDLPTLPGIYFTTGSAEINDQARYQLDKAGKILLEYPNLVVELAGHCDAKEKPSDLWRISTARAEAVKKYLQEKFRIDPERMVIQGYADTQPFAPSETETGRTLNRWVEFRVLKE
ncbi:MAG: PorV/PorQ family protein [candidate division WOR-3 bacterium]|nr:PorV/PorQ family protein [candidate division WOR-3 bacterium]